MRKGLRMLAAGAAVGLLVALGCGRLVESLLFRASPTDPVVYGLVLAALLLVSVLACLVPSVRATRVDPAVALRAE